MNKRKTNMAHSNKQLPTDELQGSDLGQFYKECGVVYVGFLFEKKI